MNITNTNPKDKDFYKDLAEINRNFFTTSGLTDNLFLDLCRVKTDSNIRGTEENVSVIIPDKDGGKFVKVNKYFDYAIKITPRIIIGEPNPQFIINRKDIRPDIIKELERAHSFSSHNIIKHSVLKIFEITSPHICYLSIAPRLKVELRD